MLDYRSDDSGGIAVLNPMQDDSMLVD